MPLEVIVQTMREAWQNNDKTLACSLARDAAPYLHPKVKDSAVVLEEFAGTISQRGDAVLAAMAAGRLSPSQAADVLAALTSQARIVELDELERRVAALEARKT